MKPWAIPSVCSVLKLIQGFTSQFYGRISNVQDPRTTFVARTEKNSGNPVCVIWYSVPNNLTNCLIKCHLLTHFCFLIFPWLGWFIFCWYSRFRFFFVINITCAFIVTFTCNSTCYSYFVNTLYFSSNFTFSLIILLLCFPVLILFHHWFCCLHHHLHQLNLFSAF